MDIYIFARALHIIAVVLWIGGVAFVTMILIPALKAMPNKHDRLQLFETLEGKFSTHAKITTTLTLVSGLYLIDFMQLWPRFLLVEFWWMHAMVLVWLLFSMVLFIFEPLFLHAWFKRQALLNAEATFKKLHTMHVILLTISLITIVGAILGSHGFRFN